jgi:LysR family nitrogen assimilation transcriptional regulator
MELRQLRYFVCVSELGSLLKASAHLHIAQPSIGQQIAALEAELGGRLFERTSRGMTLTDPGERFLAHARVVLADVERARASVVDSHAVPRGEVVVGLPTTIALAATVPLVRTCRERLPEVRLKVVEAYSGFVREWLQAGRLDIAFLYGDHIEPGMSKRALLDERLALITGIGDPPLPRRIPLSSAATRSLVLPSKDHGLRRIIDDACSALGLTLDVVAEIDSLPNVKLAVEAGIGATVLPLAAVSDEIAGHRLRASTITDASMLRRLVVATHSTRPKSSGTSAVTELAIQLIGDRVRSGLWPGRWLAKP